MKHLLAFTGITGARREPSVGDFVLAKQRWTWQDRLSRRLCDKDVKPAGHSSRLERSSFRRAFVGHFVLFASV